MELLIEFKRALLVNYVGHGGEVGLAEERVVTIPQINSWSNITNVFVSATCEFTNTMTHLFSVVVKSIKVLLPDDNNAFSVFG